MSFSKKDKMSATKYIPIVQYFLKYRHKLSSVYICGSPSNIRPQIQDVSAYTAVWVRMGFASKTDEHIGAIVEIIVDTQNSGQHLIIITAPAVPFYGLAKFFIRTTSKTQLSNTLESDCAAQHMGSDKPCIHFSERSPYLVFQITTTDYDEARSGSYDVSRWRLKVSRFLQMSSPDLMYIVDVALQRGRRRGGAHSSWDLPTGTSLAAHATAASAGRGKTQRNSEAESERDALRQVTVSFEVQLVILSDFHKPGSYAAVLATLKVNVCG